MSKYKIIYNKKACIGAGPCVIAAPNFWHLERDLSVGSKAVLHKSRLDKKTNLYKRIITDKELQVNLKAARECPAKCIHIIDTSNKALV